MARKRFHGLQKIKIRATWSKYNLYNLSRQKLTSTGGTYFQQKWAAKSATRAYHGEHVREKHWQRMFSRKLNSVVPINPQYLARYDGSEQAAGRGSGKDRGPFESRQHLLDVKTTGTPYMHMVYAPLERRLDMAVWRSLFASSARQARQMVIHGQVKVNGQKMPYPGYLLNPGDMFQVQPDRVLYATGDTKDSNQAREGRQGHKARRRVNIVREEQRAQSRAKRQEARAAKDASPTESPLVEEKPVVKTLPKTEQEQRKEARKHYQTLLDQVRMFMERAHTKYAAKKKQEVRAYVKEIKEAMSKTSNKNTDIKTIEQTLLSLAARRSILVFERHQPESEREKARRPSGESKSAFFETPIEAMSPKDRKKAQFFRKKELPETAYEEMSVEDQKKVQASLVQLRENPIDDTKPYATPWRPRPYMSAFAFIPRYLEVNQNICAAVYLRHPVARPGFAEVPTPFNGVAQQLAFNWYLKRR